MANEGTIQQLLQWVNGSRTVTKQGNKQFDVAGDNYAAAIVSAATSATVLSLPSDFGTPGWAWFTNLDATNYVEIGNNNGGSPVYTVKLKPGMSCLIPLTMAKTAIVLKANTAACDVEYVILEA